MIDTPMTMRVFAPATVANLGPGYDVLGLALEQPGDTVLAMRSAARGATLTKVVALEGASAPPFGGKNTACIAARLVLERIGADWGVALELHKGMPIGSGLGSSGASAVAAAVAANALAGSPLEREALIPICAEAERAACGSAHADNVAPGLLGGIVLVRPDCSTVRIRTGLDLHAALVTPRVEVPTRKARATIPAEVPLKEVVHNSAHLAQLIYALASDDAPLLSRAIDDRIAEPRRAPLIPGFAATKAAALEAGALGCSISGAGPSIFALCSGADGAASALAAMEQALNGERIEHCGWTSPLRGRGAEVIA